MARLAQLCALALTLSAAWLQPARAETTEAAHGIVVSRKTYAAAVNEQPFFGFAVKTPQQIAADQAFIAAVTANPGREPAYRAAIERGLAALSSGDFALAARRYNQAYLLMPSGAEVYHGFAAVVAGRFDDASYAEELFKVALRLKPGEALIQADYARLLLIQKRAAAAVPLLESAVRDRRAQAHHWSNLGFAYVQTGRLEEACAALKTALSKRPAAALVPELKALGEIAAC